MNYRLESALRDRSTSVSLLDALELADNPDYVLPEAYLPRVTDVNGDKKFTGERDCFVHSSARIINPVENMIVTFVQLDPDGSIGTDFILDVEQYVPHGFLARLTCPQRNLVPEAVNVDYIVDMDHIYLDQGTMADGIRRTVWFRPLDIRNGFYMRGTEKIRICEDFTDYTNQKSRQWLLRKYIMRR